MHRAGGYRERGRGRSVRVMGLWSKITSLQDFSSCVCVCVYRYECVLCFLLWDEPDKPTHICAPHPRTNTVTSNHTPTHLCHTAVYIKKGMQWTSAGLINVAQSLYACLCAVKRLSVRACVCVCVCVGWGMGHNVNWINH